MIRITQNMTIKALTGTATISRDLFTQVAMGVI
jgi:hypothetical protein